MSMNNLNGMLNNTNFIRKRLFQLILIHIKITDTSIKQQIDDIGAVFINYTVFLISSNGVENRYYLDNIFRYSWMFRILTS